MTFLYYLSGFVTSNVPLSVLHKHVPNTVLKRQCRPVHSHVSSYEANRVLTPTVPKQQWRPVSENELAYTAASAQCWVHA